MEKLMETIKDWLQTFGMIIIKPLPNTYITEAKKAKGKFPSAVAWLVIYAVAINAYVYLQPQHYFSPSTMLVSILILPLVFLLFIFSLHQLYKNLFGRKKDYYDELLYLTVGNFVPFILINLAVASIPKVNTIVSWAALFYPLILTIIALMAITKLKLWQSIVIVILASLVASVGFFCIGAIILSLMRAVPGTL